MNVLLIDRTKLITQTAFAKKKKITPARVNQMIKEGKLRTLQIPDTTLIIQD